MFSRFFIDRPIFAAVLSIFIILAGLAAMRVLPIAQYPEISPPVVTVTAIYPGASAPVLESTVAAPLENAINGVEDMLYMNSTSSANGMVQIQVTFNIGTDIDKATLNVNNRAKQVEPRLPAEVRRQGITVDKGSSAFLQVLAFYSPDARLNELSQRFPAGLAYAVPFDTTMFVEVSIREVVITLLEAMLLVFLVVFVFLQNWRATV